MVNKKYKDRLFRKIFGYEKYKDNLLCLYNALNNTNHTNVDNLEITTPQYYVFYNGTQDYPDKMVLKLSDAFQVKQNTGEFEWTAIMLNINFGKNKSLMERCQILHQYAILIDKVRKYREQFDDAETAVNIAVDECIVENVLSEFLLEHKAEVVDMCLTEYNEEETMEMFRQEAMEKGKLDTLIDLVRDGLLSKEQAIERLEINLEQFEQLLENTK